MEPARISTEDPDGVDKKRKQKGGFIRRLSSIARSRRLEALAIRIRTITSANGVTSPAKQPRLDSHLTTGTGGHRCSQKFSDLEFPASGVCCPVSGFEYLGLKSRFLGWDGVYPYITLK